MLAALLAWLGQLQCSIAPSPGSFEEDSLWILVKPEADLVAGRCLDVIWTPPNQSEDRLGRTVLWTRVVSLVEVLVSSLWQVLSWSSVVSSPLEASVCLSSMLKDSC